MALLAKGMHYGSSVATLLRRFAEPVKIVRIFAGASGALPTEVRLRRSGVRFGVRTAIDVWVIKETWLDREYLAIGGLERLGRDWRVVDVGAGLGDFTIFAATQCPGGTVHAYEPMPGSYELLRRNVALNGIGNVEAFQLAASSTVPFLAASSVDVDRNGNVGTSENVDPNGVMLLPAGEDGGQRIATIGLPGMLEKLPGGECDFMKIDCEGGEYDLLLNGPDDCLGRIARVSMEYHEGVTGHTVGELVRRLEGLGFAVRHRPNLVRPTLGLLYAERGVGA